MVTFIRTINTEILPFHLEVKKGICEQDSTNYYCLVNNVENNITRLSSDYTANELEFFKKLVEMIVETEGCVGSRAALNIVERLDKKMLKQDAEYLLERLCSEQWILQKEGKVSLSVRSILELNQYIQQVYPDSVKVCNICNLIVLKGESCEECGVKLHHHCAQRYFSNSRDNPRCPDNDCGALWPHPVAEPSSSHTVPATQTERPSRKRRMEVD
ncbi:non-structural maintenance of chromosomes element 1 homolog isoform X3 [Babylonia areolata]